jgi:MFS transporter, DHA2 family, multidrug resistance protein
MLTAGLALSAFETPRSDYDELYWPQAVRGVAIMFCLLPPIRLALGHLPVERVPDASALFNLMRNLGGAIGLALIDTVIFGRAEMHGQALTAKLARGDAAAFDFVGLPSLPMAMQIAPEKMQLVRRAVERAAPTTAVNEAWAMIAALTALGVLVALATRQKARQGLADDGAIGRGCPP